MVRDLPVVVVTVACDDRMRWYDVAIPRRPPRVMIKEPPISLPSEPPRLYRARGHRMAAGVASGIAAHLGVPVVAVRMVFVLLLGFHGLGLLLYAAFWAVVPVRPDGIAPPPRRDLVQLLPFVAIGLGVLLVQAMASDASGAAGTAGWLVAVIAVGAGIIWHQSAPERQRQWTESMPIPWLRVIIEEGDRPAFVLRFIGGGLLVAVGIIGVAAVYAPQGDLDAVVNGVIFALVGLGGVGVVAAPALWRMFNQLRAEREGRIREQERAELAAMVHDQVLHTLALIQRNAGEATTVQRLARGQERSLRNWLYRPTASPTERLAAALEQAAAEVEDTFAITVETVVVGDRDTDERIMALIAATREALVNAARHAGVRTVSLYAEVEPERLTIFVRDRGAGFDLSAVPDNRHGVRGSIIGRMKRHGGRAEIVSEPGEGTEVRLTLPLTRDGSGQGKDG